jgi:hypothetical protein
MLIDRTLWTCLSPGPETSQSIGSFAYRRVFLSILFDLGRAGTPFRLVDGIHDHGNVITTAPPGSLFCKRCQ